MLFASTPCWANAPWLGLCRVNVHPRIPNAGSGLQRTGGHPIVDELDPNQMSGRFFRRQTSCFVTVLVVYGQIRSVLGMQHHGIRTGRIGEPNHGRQVVDFQVNELRGIDRLLARCGHHCSNGLTDEPDTALRQKRSLGNETGLASSIFQNRSAGHATQCGDIRSGIDGSHAIRRLRRIDVDVDYFPMSVWRTCDRHVELTRHIDIIGEDTTARDEARILEPGDRLTDAEFHSVLSRRSRDF